MGQGIRIARNAPQDLETTPPPHTHTHTNLSLLWCRVIEDVVHSSHLDHNGAITQRVADGREPGDEVTQHWHNDGVLNGEDEEVEIEVQDDGSDTNQQVQIGTGEAYQSVCVCVCVRVCVEYVWGVCVWGVVCVWVCVRSACVWVLAQWENDRKLH